VNHSYIENTSVHLRQAILQFLLRQVFVHCHDLAARLAQVFDLYGIVSPKNP
jgi:hypothetical protein